MDSLIETRRRVLAIGFAAVAAVFLAACQAPAAAPPAKKAELTQPPPAVAPTQGAAAPSANDAAGAAVSIGDTSLGKILVGDKGMALYMYTQDANGESVCYDKCAVAWPPLLTTGDPKAGDGVDAKLLSTTTRKDGAKQVVYKGMPLYYFAKDKAAGDVVGQDVGKVWYVVTPSGEIVK